MLKERFVQQEQNTLLTLVNRIFDRNTTSTKYNPIMESILPTNDVHAQLCALLDQEGAVYRVIEHEAEGRTELIAQIRGNRIEQSIKSMTLQVRITKKENIYCLANVPGDCRVDFDGVKSYFNADSAAFASKEKAQALTGCVIGAIPPFSFNDQLQVLADPLVLQNEEVVFNAGRLDRSIFMKLDDYVRIAKPQIVKIALRSS
jgi:Ala-tRNA(Pro) deacylase